MCVCSSSSISVGVLKEPNFADLETPHTTEVDSGQYSCAGDKHMVVEHPIVIDSESSVSMHLHTANTHGCY